MAIDSLVVRVLIIESFSAAVYTATGLGLEKLKREPKVSIVVWGMMPVDFRLSSYIFSDYGWKIMAFCYIS